MLFFTIKHCQNFTLAKGHGAGVTMEKCMRMEMFFFLLFFVSFLHFNPSFFLLFSLFFPFILPFLAQFICWAIWAAHDWHWRCGITRVHGKPNVFGPKIWPFFSYFGSLSCPSFTCCCSYYYYTAYSCNCTRTGKLPVIVSLWGSFKKCWTAITHKYATTAERIWIPHEQQ